MQLRSFASSVLLCTLLFCSSLFAQSKKYHPLDQTSDDAQIAAIALQGLLPSIETVKRELPQILRNSGPRQISIITARFGESKNISTLSEEIEIALNYNGNNPALQAVKLSTALQLSAFLAGVELKDVTFTPTNLGQGTNFIRNAEEVRQRLDRSVLNNLLLQNGADFYFEKTRDLALNIMSR